MTPAGINSRCPSLSGSLPSFLAWLIRDFAWLIYIVPTDSTREVSMFYGFQKKLNAYYSNKSLVKTEAASCIICLQVVEVAMPHSISIMVSN